MLHEQLVASPCYVSSGKKWTCVWRSAHIKQRTALSTTKQHLNTLDHSSRPAALQAHGQFAIFSQPQCFVSAIFMLLGSHTLQSIAEQWFTSRWFGVNYNGIIMHSQLVFFHVLSLSDSYILYVECCCMAFLFQQVEVDGAFGPWRACGDPFLHHTQFSRLILLWLLRVIIQQSPCFTQKAVNGNKLHWWLECWHSGALCQKVNGTLNEESAWQHLCRKHLWLNLCLFFLIHC